MKNQLKLNVFYNFLWSNLNTNLKKLQLKNFVENFAKAFLFTNFLSLILRDSDLEIQIRLQDLNF